MKRSVVLFFLCLSLGAQGQKLPSVQWLQADTTPCRNTVSRYVVAPLPDPYLMEWRATAGKPEHGLGDTFEVYWDHTGKMNLEYRLFNRLDTNRSGPWKRVPLQKNWRPERPHLPDFDLMYVGEANVLTTSTEAREYHWTVYPKNYATIENPGARTTKVHWHIPADTAYVTLAVRNCERPIEHSSKQFRVLWPESRRPDYPDTACAGATYQIPFSANTVRYIHWQDGTRTGQDTVTHVYTRPGFYRVRVGRTADHCGDTFSRHILLTVKPAIEAAIEIDSSQRNRPIWRADVNYRDDIYTEWLVGPNNLRLLSSSLHCPVKKGPGIVRFTTHDSRCRTTIDLGHVPLRTEKAPPVMDYRWRCDTGGYYRLEVEDVTFFGQSRTPRRTWQVKGSHVQQSEAGNSLYLRLRQGSAVTVVLQHGYGEEAVLADTLSLTAPRYPKLDIGMPRTACSKNAIRFSNRSTGDFSIWYWDFRDGIKSLEWEPVYRYRLGPTLAIVPRFYAKDIVGCEHMTTGQFLELRESYAGGGLIHTDITPPFCSGDTVQMHYIPMAFLNTDWLKFTWQPGGDITDTFRTTGSGRMAVEVTDTFGCRENYRYNISRHYLPAVDFPDSLQVDETGRVALNGFCGERYRYAWYVGDERISREAELNWRPPADGPYRLHMVLEDKQTGCQRRMEPVTVQAGN